jgi:Zn-dependent oligopeptidase
MVKDPKLLISNSPVTIHERQLKQIQNKISLILLAISALEINHNQIQIPQQEQELQPTLLQVTSLLQQNQELIRRACSLLEQMNQRNEPPNSYGILKDYLHKFTQNYEPELIPGATLSPENVQQLALKLLVDLLFYSGQSGDRFLWEQLKR